MSGPPIPPARKTTPLSLKGGNFPKVPPPAAPSSDISNTSPITEPRTVGNNTAKNSRPLPSPRPSPSPSSVRNVTIVAPASSPAPTSPRENDNNDSRTLTSNQTPEL